MNTMHFMLYEIKMTLRNKAALGVLLIMPIIMIALMGYALQPIFQLEDHIEKFDVLYINKDQGDVGRNFDEFLKDKGKEYFHLISASEDTINSKLMEKGYNIAIIVPDDLSQKLEREETTSITIMSSGQDPIQEAMVKSFVEEYTQWMNNHIFLTKAYEGNREGEGSLNINAILLKTQDEYGKSFIDPIPMDSQVKDGISSFEFAAVNMLIFFLLTTGMGVGGSIIDDRANHILKRIHAYPVEGREYVMGKLLANGLIAILQAGIILLTARLLFDVVWGSQIIGIFLIIMLMIFISSALGIALSNLVASSKALTSFMTALVWLMTFISGGFTGTPIKFMEKFTVNKWAFEGMMELMSGHSLLDIKIHLFILLGVALLLWTVGIMMYNRRVSYE